jgi:hypothetical protein
LQLKTQENPMPTTTINLISPHGTPVTLTIEPDADNDEITALLDRADAIGQHYAAHGWALAEAQPGTPGPDELDAGPIFAGYPCSPTIDDNGLPTWIIVDDRQAQRRAKQGDVWYSVKLIHGNYERVLRIHKGEQAPPVRGL